MKFDSFLILLQFLFDRLPAEIVLGHDEQIIDELGLRREKTRDMSD